MGLGCKSHARCRWAKPHDALEAKEKEIRHLEKLQEEDQKRHSSLSSLRDQLDFNCRELNHQIQQLNAVNKEEQKKSTAIQLRLEHVEAEAQYASSEAVQAARQQEFAFEALMARLQMGHDAHVGLGYCPKTAQHFSLVYYCVYLSRYICFISFLSLFWACDHKNQKPRW